MTTQQDVNIGVDWMARLRDLRTGQTTTDTEAVAWAIADLAEAERVLKGGGK